MFMQTIQLRVKNFVLIFNQRTNLVTHHVSLACIAYFNHIWYCYCPNVLQKDQEDDVEGMHD